MKVLKKLFFSFSFFSFLLFTACEIGMGEALDLEAPVITIESPQTLSNSHKKITMTGTCSDNLQVTSVTIKDKERNKSYGEATINGNKWTIDLELPEGEVTLEATAHDNFGNTSIKSYKTITLLVDETAPEGLSWYVDRGNHIQIPFEEKEYLAAVNTDDATKKNIPQNEKFTIYGRMYDAMSLNTVTLILTDENGNKLTKEVKAESIPENTSIYTPSFTFTHDEIVAFNASLTTGKHYLKASYYSSDDAGNNSTRPLGYIMWYPESDIPGIWQTQTQIDIETGYEQLQIDHGSAIPLHFFDDDEIKEYGYSFISKENPNYLTLSNTAASVKSFISNPANASYGYYEVCTSSISDVPTSLSSEHTENIGSYVLICYIQDINGKEKYRFIETIVIDAANPLLIIETPAENTVPEMKNGSIFEVSGYSYDTSGSKNVKIAFIPEKLYATSDLRLERANKLFANPSIADTANGEIIKTLTFEENKIGKKDGNWVKEAFFFEFDAVKDFEKSGQANKAKEFILLVEDIDGNKVIKQLRINGDSQLPEINIKTPAENMEVCDYSHNNLIIRFKGEKPSKLPIDETSYKVIRKIDDNNSFIWTSTPENLSLTNGNPIRMEDSDNPGKYLWKIPSKVQVSQSPEQYEWKIPVIEKDLDFDGYYKLEIPKETVKQWAEEGVCASNGTEIVKADTQPVFTLYVSDVLGNIKSEQRAVVLSPLPILDNISTINSDGIYKKGDLITLQTKFSDTVKVTGKPKLKLKYNASDSSYVTADFKTGSGTDTLTFEWTVPEGAGSSKLICDGFETEVKNGKTVLTNNALIETGTSGTGNATLTVRSGFNLQDKSTLIIDGIIPTLKDISISSSPEATTTNGMSYVKKDTDIIATLEFSENIFVSGSPKLKLQTPTGILDFSFQSIAGHKVIFSHRVDPESKEGAISYVYSSSTKSFSEEDKKLITDEAGNIISLSEKTQPLLMTIDITAPATAPLINIEAGIYNTPQDLILSGIEDNAIAEFSLDSGVTWNKYTDTYKIPAGLHTLITRQTDFAGNVSPASAPVSITINNTFPDVQSILIAGADGDYIVGDTLKFKVFLSEKVKPFGDSAIKLTFKNKEETLKIKGVEKSSVSIYAKPEDTDVNTIEFEYTVQKNDYIKGIQVTDVDFGEVKDKYENKQDSKTHSQIENLIKLEDCNRKDIVLDGVVPFIETFTPLNNAVGKYLENDDAANGYKKGDFIITLKFSEPVSKEAGNITLQRTEGWSIPAVFTAEEFLDIYNRLTDVKDKENLMLTENGNGSGMERLDAWTGIAVGPYKKITHGLKTENGKYVPDTDTKYVLDFDLGLESGSKSLDPHSASPVTVSVADIRTALEKANYHKTIIDVNSSNVKVDGNTVKIRYPATYKDNVLVKDGIANGIEWQLIIDSGSFRDNTGNIFEGLSTGATGIPDYILNSDKVSTPVVRVDRYSHGLGAHEPKADGSFVDLTGWKRPQGTYNSMPVSDALLNSNANGRAIAPTGCVRVRIDSQTKDSTIKYVIYESGNKKTSDNTGADYYQYASDGAATANQNKTNVAVMYNSLTDLGYTLTTIPDASTNAEELNFSTATLKNLDSNNHIFVIADTPNNTGYKNASKKYVKAIAEKDNYKSSSESVEGVFKTLVYLKYNNDGVNIEGGTAKGGEPNLSGFPLRDATKDIRYSKNAYWDGSCYAWVTYEIIDNYSVLIHKNNYSKNYPTGTYGQILYIKNFQSW